MSHGPQNSQRTVSWATLIGGCKIASCYFRFCQFDHTCLAISYLFFYFILFPFLLLPLYPSPFAYLPRFSLPSISFHIFGRGISVGHSLSLSSDVIGLLVVCFPSHFVHVLQLPSFAFTFWRLNFANYSVSRASCVKKSQTRRECTN